MSHTTVLHIHKERLHMRKIASRWVPHSLTEIQKWQRYDSARMHLERYKKKGDAFLHRIIALDEAWARACKPEMKRQSNEWRHYRSPAKPKCGRIPEMLRLCSFSPTTVPASSSHMLCPIIGQSQASTTPISWSIICAVLCGRRDHTFSVKTHQSFYTTTLGRMSLT